MQPMNTTIAAVAMAVALTCSPAFADESPVKLVFDGSTFSTSSPDLFQGKASLSPGDTFTTRIVLTNESSEEQTFFFSLDEPESLSEQGQTLIEEAELSVASPEGAIYYRGPLCGPDVYEQIELQTCKPGEGSELVVTINVPASLGNDYAMSKDMLHWRFTALPTSHPKQGATAPNAAATAAPGSAYDKTGYDTVPALATAAALACVGVIAFALGSRKRR